MRTLLVGLDAACLPVLEPLFESGSVPTLERIFSEGASGPLESQIPPWTASAWPSMYTGMNPGKHGVFDFLAFDGYDWDIVNGSHVRERTIWEYLDLHGLSSVVVNAPVAHPPRPIDGAIIPGYLAPEDPETHPAGLLDDVRAEIGGYRVYAERETDERIDDEEKFEDYLALTRIRGEAFRYLSDRFDPDFGFLQFQKTDAIFHDFPGDRDKVERLYHRVDEQIRATLDACDPETVIVASDHGIGEYRGYECRVNELLRRAGRVTTTKGGSEVPSWFRIKDEQLVRGGDTERRSAVERLAKVAARYGMTYQRGKALLERLGLANLVGRHVSVGTVLAASESVDFEASQAFLRSPSELGVRMNVSNRDPAGAVPESEYASVRDELISFFEGATTPEGDPVFERVLPREEVFAGPRSEQAVDVVLVPDEFDHSFSGLIGEAFADPEPWNHKLEGLVALSGGSVDSSASLSGAHLFDIAPTVLSTMDVPPDERMDGTPLPAVEAIRSESYPAFDPGDRYGTEDESIEQRLSDLGYLE